MRSLGLRPPQLVPLGPALGPLLAARRRGLGGGGVGRQRGRGLVLSVGGGGVGDTPLPGPSAGPRSSLVRRGRAGGRETEQLTGVAEDGRGFGLGPPHPRLGRRAPLAGRRARVRGGGRHGEAVEDARRHRGGGGVHLGRLGLRPLGLGLGPRLSLVHRGCWRFGRREGEVAAVVVVVDVVVAGDVDLADVVAGGVEASRPRVAPVREELGQARPVPVPHVGRFWCHKNISRQRDKNICVSCLMVLSDKRITSTGLC